MKPQSTYLNCGCGSRFDPSWENIDFISYYPEVKQYNLSEGIPYNDSEFEVVYHSHVLEHFTKAGGKQFLTECFRVLKKNGIIRIAVPDLERLARSYLENLEKAAANSTEKNNANYNWSVIELFDQVVRNNSGGEMKKYWDQKTIINEDLIVSRLGFEFLDYRKKLLEANSHAELPAAGSDPKLSILHPIRFVKEKIKQKVLKPYQSYIKLGKFRLGGEIHQWMYDRYSLTLLLQELGFREVKIMDAFTSRIPDWEKYNFLDVEQNQPRKPDSIFIEAIK